MDIECNYDSDLPGNNCHLPFDSKCSRTDQGISTKDKKSAVDLFSAYLEHSFPIRGKYVPLFQFLNKEGVKE